jgi:hypothetical protein
MLQIQLFPYRKTLCFRYEHRLVLFSEAIAFCGVDHGKAWTQRNVLEVDVLCVVNIVI